MSTVISLEEYILNKETTKTRMVLTKLQKEEARIRITKAAHKSVVERLQNNPNAISALLWRYSRLMFKRQQAEQRLKKVAKELAVLKKALK